MILYHGSSLEIPAPDLTHSRPNVDFGRGLLKCGSAIVPFLDNFPRNRLYQLMTTRPSEMSAAEGTGPGCSGVPAPWGGDRASRRSKRNTSAPRS